MLETFFQNTTQQVLSKYKSQLNQINLIGKKFKSLTDVELQEKSNELKKRLRVGETKESIINEAFALVREIGRASCRERV